MKKEYSSLARALPVRYLYRPAYRKHLRQPQDLTCTIGILCMYLHLYPSHLTYNARNPHPRNESPRRRTATTMPKATVHLIAIHPHTNVSTFLDQLRLTSFDEPPYLLKARPCGWIQAPRRLHRAQLTASAWDIFLVTRRPTLPAGLAASLAAHISAPVAIPQDQLDALLSRAAAQPAPGKDTPPLPPDWQPDHDHDHDHASCPGPGYGRRGSKFYGQIPSHEVLANLGRAEHAGELRLDHAMAWFLSSAEPASVRGSPVSLFNLFRYKDGDRATHEAYMRGFREAFGTKAGARVRFMGEVGELGFEGEVHGGEEDGDAGGWDEANLTQYDSVWHYAYMLSTEGYRELNREKVEGLDDTCILLVSELAL